MMHPLLFIMLPVLICFCTYKSYINVLLKRLNRYSNLDVDIAAADASGNLYRTSSKSQSQCLRAFKRVNSIRFLHRTRFYDDVTNRHSHEFKVFQFQLHSIFSRCRLSQRNILIDISSNICSVDSNRQFAAISTDQIIFNHLRQSQLFLFVIIATSRKQAQRTHQCKQIKQILFHIQLCSCLVNKIIFH